MFLKNIIFSKGRKERRVPKNVVCILFVLTKNNLNIPFDRASLFGQVSLNVRMTIYRAPRDLTPRSLGSHPGILSTAIRCKLPASLRIGYVLEQAGVTWRGHGRCPLLSAPPHYLYKLGQPSAYSCN